MTKIRFGGEDLFERFGIFCETRRDALAPGVKERNIHIPGKHGSYWPGESFYEDREVELTCVTTVELTRQQLRELAYVLSGKKRLVLSDEPEKYYMAQLCDFSVIQHIGRKGTKHTLRFRCEPFAYGETVTIPVRTGENAVKYQGTAPAPTLLVLKNIGTTPVTTIHIRAVTQK